MPVYEYKCKKCGTEFEVMRPISQADDPAKCPKCKGKGEKLVSVFGSKVGFYTKAPEKGAFRKQEDKGK
jgi:putative FmdB family regulatory protein